MPDLEDQLLDAVGEDPGDEVSRLAYADWLEEQGRPDEANVVREVGQAYSVLRLARALFKVTYLNERKPLPPVYHDILKEQFGGSLDGVLTTRDFQAACAYHSPAHALDHVYEATGRVGTPKEVLGSLPHVEAFGRGVFWRLAGAPLP